MSRTHKDIPWRLKHERIWGDMDDSWFKRISRYNGYNDHWRSQVVKDRGSERASWRTFNSRSKDFYNTFGEANEHLLEPQTKSIYVH